MIQCGWCSGVGIGALETEYLLRYRIDVHKGWISKTGLGVSLDATRLIV